MHEGIRFLLGFVAVLFLLWYVGNHLQGSLANPAYIGSSTTERGGNGSSGYQAPEELPTSTQGISQELERIESDASRIQSLLDQARVKSEASVYQGTLVLNGSGNAWSTKPTSEYISLNYQRTNSNNQSQKILITGWEAVSGVTNKSAVIGKGAYLPYSGQVNAEEPIFVSPGDRVVINSGRSPIGVSFRVNKCSGFFEQFQDFSPSLPFDCPRPETENLPTPPNQLNDRCLDYLETLSRCTVPLGELPLDLSPECGQYLRTEINYNKCVEHHKDDADFYKPEWRVFLGRDTELFKDRREVIKVLDLDKKVVDSISY